jgi:hypothetical protein
MDPCIPLPGVYAKTIHDLSKNGYGNLKYLDEFMKEHRKAKYTVLNFSPSFEVEPVHKSAQRKASRDMVGKCRSLYIVEDLSGDVIEELGAAFNIELQFFAEHLRAVEWEHHDFKYLASIELNIPIHSNGGQVSRITKKYIITF